MKIRTLNDMKFHWDYIDSDEGDILGDIDIKNELRQEAIKWIKFGFHQNKEGKWIKWKDMFREFFNITEEDLK